MSRKRILRVLAVVATLPAVLMVLFIAFFVAQAEIAHDEERCPFHEVERRQLDESVEVVDEARRCQDGVVEHRWVVMRGGERNEIGRRRLHAPYYTADAYSWRAAFDEDSVRVFITNAGTEPAEFGERPRARALRGAAEGEP